jgi:hypothetical protein
MYSGPACRTATEFPAHPAGNFRGNPELLSEIAGG